MQEMMSTGIALMARKQMLGIKERAERPKTELSNGSGEELSGSHEPQIEIPSLENGEVQPV
jgi:hypothetical protein